MSWEDAIVFFFSAVFSILCGQTAAERPQIGFYPLKGNMWRAKHISEISASFTSEFKYFISKNVSVMYSIATNQSYFYSYYGSKYAHYKEDPNLCEHGFDYQAVQDMVDDPSQVFPEGVPHKGITVYFLCDNHCCADECCQRDFVFMSLGIGLIILSIITVFAYLCIYLVGVIIAIRNGRIFGRQNDHFALTATPSKSTSTTIVRNRADF
ncbi:hypothetical protein L596_028019 [Steinernema carpocapsae]|uniref:CX domain-containing protein n=1 Tax=Steinernema carpocapsae TaxID=34508 RepID=A0A4U5LXA3_STECR|nr:hypothetical protein L596_028019 [Steinernema carpocapsae]